MVCLARSSVYVSCGFPERLISKVRDEGELWMGSIVGIEPLASSNIMINNISVSFGAVAGGITAGIYTIYIMGIERTVDRCSCYFSGAK